MHIHQLHFVLLKKASGLLYRACTDLDVAKVTSYTIPVRTAHFMKVRNLEGMGLSELTSPEIG